MFLLISLVFPFCIACWKGENKKSKSTELGLFSFGPKQIMSTLDEYQRLLYRIFLVGGVMLLYLSFCSFHLSVEYGPSLDMGPN